MRSVRNKYCHNLEKKRFCEFSRVLTKSPCDACGGGSGGVLACIEDEWPKHEFLEPRGTDATLRGLCATAVRECPQFELHNRRRKE